MNTIIDHEVLLWLLPGIKAAIIFIVGYIAARVLSRFAHTFVSKYANPQQSMIFKKIVFFTLIILFLITSLHQLGFKLSVLLGSAGIASAAIGFASRSSIANVISGIFLIMERSFEVGDMIKVKGQLGKVESIDFLSVKLSTPENTMVRIPSEVIINTEIVNLSRYPRRRIDINVGVDYGQNLDIVRQTFQNIVAANEIYLNKPEPSMKVTEFADSSINCRLSVWASKKNFNTAKDLLYELINTEFNNAKINIPYNQLTIHVEKETADAI